MKLSLRAHVLTFWRQNYRSPTGTTLSSMSQTARTLCAIARENPNCSSPYSDMHRPTFAAFDHLDAVCSTGRRSIRCQPPKNASMRVCSSVITVVGLIKSWLTDVGRARSMCTFWKKNSQVYIRTFQKNRRSTGTTRTVPLVRAVNPPWPIRTIKMSLCRKRPAPERSAGAKFRRWCRSSCTTGGQAPSSKKGTMTKTDEQEVALEDLTFVSTVPSRHGETSDEEDDEHDTAEEPKGTVEVEPEISVTQRGRGE